jgi:hypothetical protein
VTEDERIYGPPDRPLWVRMQPSVISGKRPCVNAHTRTGGTSYKADYTTIIPITDEEHKLVHQHGWSYFGLTQDQLDQFAAETEERWKKELVLPW